MTRSSAEDEGVCTPIVKRLKRLHNLQYCSMKHFPARHHLVMSTFTILECMARNFNDKDRRIAFFNREVP
jgi:hypothetical protein